MAAISIVVYREIQNRARASAVVSDLKSTEKAFRLYFTSRRDSAWPRENYGGLPANPSIQYFIDNEAGGFSGFMSTAPNLESQEWEHDSDGSDKNIPCGDLNGIDEGINMVLIRIPTL